MPREFGAEAAPAAEVRPEGQRSATTTRAAASPSGRSAARARAACRAPRRNASRRPRRNSSNRRARSARPARARAPVRAVPAALSRRALPRRLERGVYEELCWRAIPTPSRPEDLKVAMRPARPLHPLPGKRGRRPSAPRRLEGKPGGPGGARARAPRHPGTGTAAAICRST